MSARLTKLTNLLANNPPTIKLTLSHYMLIGSNIYFCYEFYNLYSFYKNQYYKMYFKNKNEIILPFQNYFMESMKQPFKLKYYFDDGNVSIE